MLYHIINFGCQMNEHDAEIMAGTLEKMGYNVTNSREKADIILINTCCVRETAENKVYGLLGRLKKMKAENPSVIIGVGGCMTQQEEAASNIKKRFPFVDIIFGTNSLYELPDMIQEVHREKKRVYRRREQAGPVQGSLPVKRSREIKAWVPIIYGCNNFCTYCIVPYVRGRETSRPPGEIMQEINDLAMNNYKEITLLGQNVNSYGKDLKEKMDFADLLALIDKMPGLARIRFMTSHPRDFSDKLIQTIAGLNKVCQHFHLPVQAGSNSILKKMNRGYSREDYLNLVSKIKAAIPGAVFTTDIMVGFPGETEEDFSETLDLVEKVRFSGAYTFVYNPRRDTPAFSMEQVPGEIKTSRIRRLIELQNKISLELNKEEVGQTVEVLVEEESQGRSNYYSGRTRTAKLVLFASPKETPGNLVMVRINSAGIASLEGEKN